MVVWQFLASAWTMEVVSRPTSGCPNQAPIVHLSYYVSASPPFSAALCSLHSLGPSDGSDLGTTELSMLILLEEIVHQLAVERDLDEDIELLPSQCFQLIGGTGIGGYDSIAVIIPPVLIFWSQILCYSTRTPWDVGEDRSPDLP